MILNNQIYIKRERRYRLITFLLTLACVTSFILFVPNMLASFLIATLIVFTLKPAVFWLERRGLEHDSATTAIFLMWTILIIGSLYLLAPVIGFQFSTFYSDLPRYKEGVFLLVEKIDVALNRYTQDMYEFHLVETIMPYLQKYFLSGIETLPQKATQVFTVLLLAPFFAFFILKDGRSFYRWLLRLVPNNHFELVLSLSHKINEQVGGFIRARILESIIVGVVILVGLLFINFPFAVLLSVFAAVTNLIPYVGPLIGAAPALIIAVIDKDSSFLIFLVTMIYLFAQLIDIVFIIPLVVARIVNLHPVIVVLSIIVGAELMGIIGMIISIPITSALKLVAGAVFAQLLAQKSDS